MLLRSMIPTSNGSAHSVLDGTLGENAIAILGTMQNVLVLRHSCLLSKYKVTMCAMVPFIFSPWGLMGVRDTIIGLLPTQNPHRFAAVG